MEPSPANPKAYTLSIANSRSIPDAVVDIPHIWRWLRLRGISAVRITSPSAGVVEVTCLGDPTLVWPDYDHAGSRRALAKTQLEASTTLVGFRTALITLLEGVD